MVFNNNNKKKINEKINKLELLNKDEFSFLIRSITTLYTDLNRQKQKRNETLSCLKCKNICPENSKFCNICGYLLTIIINFRYSFFEDKFMQLE